MFWFVEVLCELESVDWAIAMPHDSSAIAAKQINFFITDTPWSYPDRLWLD
jgi:hypothetical protein